MNLKVMENKNGNLIVIVMIIVVIVGFVGYYVVANKIQSPATQVNSAQESNLGSLENTYKNEKYAFTIKYPKNWKVSEKYGINFFPASKNEADFSPEKLNKEKDCAVGLSVLSVSEDTNVVPCTTKLSDATYGRNRFVKCLAVSVQDNSEGYSFRIIHPKMGNLIDISPVATNKSCNAIVEDMLGSLNFQ